MNMLYDWEEKIGATFEKHMFDLLITYCPEHILRHRRNFQYAVLNDSIWRVDFKI